MEIQFENLVWKFSLEMIVGNLDGNLVWKLLLEIQLDLWKFRWKFSLEILMEIQLEILILGNLDPWKFSMQIQLEIQFQNLEWKFSLEMIACNLDGNLVGSLKIQLDPWKFR